jgi:hypothetical protein
VSNLVPQNGGSLNYVNGGESQLLCFFKAIPMMLARLATALLFVVVASPAQVITVSPHGPIRTLTEARDAARAQRRSGITSPITITVRAGTYFCPRHWSLALRTATPSGRELTASTLSLAAAGSSPAGPGPPVRPGRRTLPALTSINYLSTAGALLAHGPRRMVSFTSREAAPPASRFSCIFAETTSSRSGQTNQTWNL